MKGLKKTLVNVPGSKDRSWCRAPAYTFGIDGLALFKRPDDAKANWNVIHVDSGLALVIGARTREDAVEQLDAEVWQVDWTEGYMHAKRAMRELRREQEAAA